MNKQTDIAIYTDGGARGNPGPSAIGVFILDCKNVPLLKLGKKIENGTNNVAEYSAVIHALSWVLNHFEKIKKPKRIRIFSDSLLLVSQLNGVWKVKDPILRELLVKVRQLEVEIGASVSYVHVRREKNRQADRLVNMALDNLL